MSQIPEKNFLNIIKTHQGIISSLCAAYYNEKEDRNDARQDIILQLWKSFPSFRNKAKISTWIYKVSLNTIFNKLKKEKSYQITSSLHDCNLISPSATDDNLQCLKQLIQTLKKLDKAIVLLYLEGYCYKEISSILDLSYTNVSTRMNRIKSELKRKYNPGPYEFK